MHPIPLYKRINNCYIIYFGLFGILNKLELYVEDVRRAWTLGKWPGNVDRVVLCCLRGGGRILTLSCLTAMSESITTFLSPTLRFAETHWNDT